MKLLPSILLIAALTASAGENLLKNPSFEDDSNWKPWWRQGQFDSAAAKEGKRALRLDFNGGKTGVFQTVEVNQSSPAPLIFGGWFKTADISVGKGQMCRMRVAVYTSDGKEHWNQDAKLTSHAIDFSGTSDWKYCERTLSFKEPVTKVILFIYGDAGSGSLFADNIFLETEKGKTPVAPCVLREEEGKTVAENQYLKVAIDARHGASAISLIDKSTGKNLTENNGAFKDCLEELSMSALWNMEYSREIIKNTPEEIVLRYSCSPEALPYFTIAKEYRLLRNASMLEVAVTLRNAKEAMAPRVFTYRTHNIISSPYGKNRWYYPTSRGVMTFQETGSQQYYRDIVDGWAAFESGGNGAFVTVDYSALDFFYNWFGKPDTLEWFMKSVKIPEGSEWNTKMTLTPCREVTGFSGAAPGLAVRITAQGKDKTRVELIPGIMRAVDVKLGNNYASASLQPGKNIVMDFDVKPEKVLECTVSDSSKTLLLSCVQAFGEHVYKPAATKVPTVIGLKPVSISPEIVTPHRKWATLKKPLKVLGIAHSYTARELVELKQRVDLEITPVFFCGGFGTPQNFMQYAEKDSNLWLEEQLKKDYDVILIGGVNGKSFSPENQKKIAEKVRAGTGLLAIFPNNVPPALAELLPLREGREIQFIRGPLKKAEHAVTEGIPLSGEVSAAPYAISGTPILYAGNRPFAAVSEAGKGRVAAFGWPVGKAASLTKWFNNGGLTPNPTWNSTENVYGLLVRTLLWCSNRDVKTLAGEPVVPIRRTEVKVLSKTEIEADLPAGEVKVTDPRGRVLATVKHKGGPLRLHLENPLFRAAELTASGNIREWFYLPFERKKMDDYSMRMWGLEGFYDKLPEWLADLYYKRIAEAGIETIQVHNAGWNRIPDHLETASLFLWRNGFETALNNIAPQHIGQSFMQAKKEFDSTQDKKYLARNPCLHDPAYQENARKRIREMVGMMKPFKPVLYCCGDENSLTQWSIAFDFCQSEHTLTAFREWLETKYSSISELNRDTGMQFSSFADVFPPTTEEARKSKKYKLWLLHREFMDKSFADFFAMVRVEVEKLDPGVPISLSGTNNPTAYNGGDWFRLMKIFGNMEMAPYRGTGQELMRSFAKPEFRALPYNGGYANIGKNLTDDIWKSAFLFRGAGVNFFIDAIALNPDLTFSRQLEDFHAATQPFRQGLGKLLLNSTPDPDKVALLFSMDSLRLATVRGESENFFNSVDSWQNYLNDCGIHWVFIDPSELEKYRDWTVIDPARQTVRTYRQKLEGEFSAPEARIFKFRNGGTRILGLLGSKETIVNLHGKYHVYDLRNRKYLGYISEFKTIPPNMFALEPVKIAPPILSVSGNRWKIDADKGRVIRLEVTDPAGKAAPCYSRNLLSPASGEIPFALNDENGTWKLRAIDMTGEFSEAKIRRNEKGVPFPPPVSSY